MHTIKFRNMQVLGIYFEKSEELVLIQGGITWFKLNLNCKWESLLKVVQGHSFRPMFASTFRNEPWYQASNTFNIPNYEVQP